MKRYSDRREIVFENPDEIDGVKRPGLRSQLRIATAGKEEFGRSKDVHLLHCSESPYWPNPETTELSVLNSVPDLPGTMVFKEGTPNGAGTKFHRDYKAAKAGESPYLPYFMTWFEFNEYSMALEVSPEAFRDSLQVYATRGASTAPLKPSEMGGQSRWLRSMSPTSRIGLLQCLTSTS
jgi:hypothetical protein